MIPKISIMEFVMTYKNDWSRLQFSENDCFMSAAKIRWVGKTYLVQITKIEENPLSNVIIITMNYSELFCSELFSPN